jgi:hypothetical protein
VKLVQKISSVLAPAPQLRILQIDLSLTENLEECLPSQGRSGTWACRIHKVIGISYLVVTKECSGCDRMRADYGSERYLTTLL